jgi:hypothetical protein
VVPLWNPRHRRMGDCLAASEFCRLESVQDAHAHHTRTVAGFHREQHPTLDWAYTCGLAWESHSDSGYEAPAVAFGCRRRCCAPLRLAASLGSSADRSLRNSCPALAILRPAAMRRIAKELR